MIRINLLPFRAARKKENIRRQVSLFLLSFLFITVALIYYHSTLSANISRLNTHIEDTKKDLATLKKITQEIAELKRVRDLLNKKSAIITTLEVNRRAPVELLDAMTQLVIAKRMWFTSLVESGTVVNIKGIALDNQTVADFMTRLEGSGFFTSVNLKTIQQQALKKDINLKSFDISCNKAAVKKAVPSKAKKQ